MNWARAESQSSACCCRTHIGSNKFPKLATAAGSARLSIVCALAMEMHIGKTSGQVRPMSNKQLNSLRQSDQQSKCCNIQHVFRLNKPTRERVCRCVSVCGWAPSVFECYVRELGPFYLFCRQMQKCESCMEQ